MESGNLRAVPIAIKNPANTKFTEALIKSNAAPSAKIASSVLNRASIQRFVLSGTILDRLELIELDNRTITRATGEVPKASSPSS